jgi:cation:H+ antiporter
MLLTWVWLLGSLAVILLGCDLFTNGIEWAGKKLRLGEGAVGSILAAVGTCLPETLIAILAIVFGRGTGSGEQIGIGAILGAPLMLSTLAFFVTGVAVLFFSWRGKRAVDMHVTPRVVARDLRFFFVVFGLAAAGSFLPAALNYAAAGALVAIYGLYVLQTFRDKGRRQESVEDISPLHLARRSPEPPLWLAVAQSLAGLAVLAYGAHVFVGELSAVAVALHIRPLVLSLILTPIATELPEKFNSVLWVRQKKDTLAIGNITGAMVFQSSVPTAIGMVFTPWDLDRQALGCVAVAMCSAGAAWVDLKWRKRLSPYSLLAGGAFYAIYLLWVLG